MAAHWPDKLWLGAAVGYARALNEIWIFNWRLMVVIKTLGRIYKLKISNWRFFSGNKSGYKIFLPSAKRQPTLPRKSKFSSYVKPSA